MGLDAKMRERTGARQRISLVRVVSLRRRDIQRAGRTPARPCALLYLQFTNTVLARR